MKLFLARNYHLTACLSILYTLLLSLYQTTFKKTLHKLATNNNIIALYIRTPKYKGIEVKT